MITTDTEVEGDAKMISCSYADLPSTVAVGSTIFIADGSITCHVTDIMETSIKVKVLNDCTLGSRKSMNLPGAIVNLPTLTEKDENDLIEFCLK